MVNFLTQAMAHYGYLGLAVLAFLQACCIPWSSEATFALAGLTALTQPGKFSLVAVIVVGVLAEMAGSTTAYAIGRRGGRHLLDRYGRWVLITRSDLDRAETFFAGRGAWAVAVARALPVVRCFAGFGAGVVEVPIGPFAVFNLIGTTAWVTGFSLLGYHLGHEVTKFFHRFTLVGAALVVLFVVALVAHRWHAIRKESAHRPQTESATSDAANVKAPARTGRGGAHRAGRGPGD